MRVKELIAELQKLDPNLIVTREYDFEGPLVEVRFADVVNRVEQRGCEGAGEANFYRKPFEGEKVVAVVKLD